MQYYINTSEESVENYKKRIVEIIGLYSNNEENLDFKNELKNFYDLLDKEQVITIVDKLYNLYFMRSTIYDHSAYLNNGLGFNFEDNYDEKRWSFSERVLNDFWENLDEAIKIKFLVSFCFYFYCAAVVDDGEGLEYEFLKLEETDSYLVSFEIFKLIINIIKHKKLDGYHIFRYLIMRHILDKGEFAFLNVENTAQYLPFMNDNFNKENLIKKLNNRKINNVSNFEEYSETLKYYIIIYYLKNIKKLSANQIQDHLPSINKTVKSRKHIELDLWGKNDKNSIVPPNIEELIS